MACERADRREKERLQPSWERRLPCPQSHRERACRVTSWDLGPGEGEETPLGAKQGVETLWDKGTLRSETWGRDGGLERHHNELG